MFKITNLVPRVFNKVYQLYYFSKCRKRLRNTNFTIISPNCYAGLMYHRLGLQFLSPTINLYFPFRKQYLKFVSNIKYYLEQDLVFEFDNNLNCPIGYIEDIQIVFNHYKSIEHAKNSWDSRKTRVNYDNLYIIFDDIDDIEYNDLVEFNKVNCKGKVIFTSKEYKNLENTVVLSTYKGKDRMEHYLMQKSKYTGKNPADKDFDFVAWLNS